MNEYHFYFMDLKAFTLNKAKKPVWKLKKMVNTKEYNEFKNKVNAQLLFHTDVIRDFNKNYDEKEHIVSAEYRFYHKSITKENTINKLSGDHDNFIKPIQDLIFKLLSADDSCIRHSSQTLIHSIKPKIEIIYRLRDIKTIL